ncbi:MAG: radical SAM family heme chaperone HemW [Gemmatimonadales bacterium]
MHLYLHVPFCQRRCSYCDFSIAVRKRIPAQEYVAAVLAELRRSADPGPAARGERTIVTSADPGAMRQDNTTPPGPGSNAQPPTTESRVLNSPGHGPGVNTPATGSEPDTIYFGGGTPSLLPPEAIQTLLGALTPGWQPGVNQPGRRVDVEITLEANPEDVTPDAARAWRSAGINRVSLGAQSFDDRVLTWMHRSHDAARIGAAVHALRGAGIENISLDLIFGLPEELQRDWENDLDMLCSLRPAHCSLYGLTVEPRTPLDRWISRGATSLPADDRYAEEYLFAHRRLTADGLQFYEVSNAARAGYRSRHNSAYWSGRPYLGLGPAAHSFDGRARRWNLSAWEAYRRAIAEGRSPVESEEMLTDEQREMERVYLGLRTAEGLPLTAPYRPLPSPSPTVDWVRQGWVEATNGTLRCTPEGWLRLDSLVRELAVQGSRF